MSLAFRSCSRPAASAMTARARPGSVRARRGRRRLGRDRRLARGRRSRGRLRRRILGDHRALGRRPPRASGTRRRTIMATASCAIRRCRAATPSPPRSPRRARPTLRIAEALDHVGVLTVEFFATADGPIVNEIAPRVHNSGHWTIEGARHLAVRAAYPRDLRPAARLDRLVARRRDDGQSDRRRGRRWPELVAEQGAHLHLYGKGEARPGRKMGHVDPREPRA